MRSVLVLVVALALTNAFNLKTFLKKEIGEIEKYLEMQPLGQSKIPTKCDSSATYAITVTQADLNPYPVKQGQDETVDVSATGNYDVVLTKGTAKVKVLFVTIPYDFDIPAEFQKVTQGQTISQHLTQAVPSLPISLHDNKVTVELKDANGQVHYCGYTTATVDALPPEELQLLNAGPQITKCEDVDYEVEVKSFDISPYPIQKGKSATIDAIGVSSQNVKVSDLKVQYAGASLIDIKVDKDCVAGQNCEFKDSEDIPYIPFISSATLTANVNDSNGKSVGCYKLKVKLDDSL